MCTLESARRPASPSAKWPQGGAARAQGRGSEVEQLPAERTIGYDVLEQTRLLAARAPARGEPILDPKEELHVVCVCGRRG